jgi:probable phosphomutase (TIGR03848 family)
MTVFVLIRHGLTDVVGKRIVGRLPGIHLNETGKHQAQTLAVRISVLPIAELYSSPLERTRETAQLIAERLKVPVQTEEEVIEVDFGEWTGKTFEELHAIPEWRYFNRVRSTTRPPRGESMLDVAHRAVGVLERLRRAHRDKWIGIVSHGDWIRGAVAQYCGIPLDLFQRIEVHPASITLLQIEDWGSRLLLLNETGDLRSFISR